jgi:menaquinone-dependent protoporphyrinogen oxidase
MTRPVLVAYATKHGSTKEVADAIAAVLLEHGLDAHVVEAAAVDDLAGYGGAVLGGSLYMGRWHRDARQFLRSHAGELAELPLGVFAIGPQKSTEHDLAGARKQLDAALAKAQAKGVEPDRVAVFGGVVDPSQLRFPFSRMPATDARDWPAIRAWAGELAALFAAAAPTPA